MTPGRPVPAQREAPGAAEGRHWPDFPHVASLEFRSFCCSLLALDRCSRLGFPSGAGALVAHPFFTPLDWDALIAKAIEPPFQYASDDMADDSMPVRESISIRDAFG